MLVFRGVIETTIRFCCWAHLKLGNIQLGFACCDGRRMRRHTQGIKGRNPIPISSVGSVGLTSGRLACPLKQCPLRLYEGLNKLRWFPLIRPYYTLISGGARLTSDDVSIVFHPGRLTAGT